MARQTARVKNQSKEKRAGILSFSVCGYKSVCSEQHIEVRPLTVLAGANSSGKSSMLQPLLLLKQTLEAPFDPGALLLDGPNVRLTSAEQLICKMGGPCTDGFHVNFSLNDKSALKMTFARLPGVGMAIDSMVYSEGHRETRIHPNMTSEEIQAAMPKHLQSLRDQLLAREKKEMDWVVVRDRCFLYFDLKLSGGRKTAYLLGGVSPAPLVGSHLQRMIHLPGLRGNPARTYSATAVSETFPGTFESYVASVVNHWQATKDDRLKQLGKDLETLGLTWKVDARPVDDTRVELRVGRLPHSKRGGAHDLVSIADVGFGVSQTLPVLVALRVAEPGQIVYLEQPEIHLHPRAQRKLAYVLADAAKRGVVVIVETHSSLLLRGIQTLVATRGGLPPSLVKLHWFERDAETGATVVTSADLDEQGAFGTWPEDFDEVSLAAEKEYLDAVERWGEGS
ncbi:MAG: AAA family ATPase [Deltaproteobacteria bacterium]|nr:AAA family ATPase [Deltaproteobacteria bacterium]